MEMSNAEKAIVVFFFVMFAAGLIGILLDL